jgi:hypothetical protein
MSGTRLRSPVVLLALVPSSRLAGAAPADLERAYAAMMQWFERHLGSAAK